VVISIMKTPRLAPTTPHTPGFNRTLSLDTNLGLAMLILEDEEGHYEPINIASTIEEAREMAISDSQRRGPDSLCPTCTNSSRPATVASSGWLNFSLPTFEGKRKSGAASTHGLCDELRINGY
jgi:hypothetical protein